ncbi:LacI family DNA-binding transcriptional regulator [Bifidobacterium criceti]|uniref:LacI family transcriptional regulator n=1 Tax=Bifidobacterium criceti TaxID=1960969 RepID=A0A2A2EFQ6_9BIFI|nr:LacI family DNA-binding transcriptional regulator [Bifidobacterium criceti]PAU67817.1 LacI family transcriptional regulator [Bifidobacterium criceti]
MTTMKQIAQRVGVSVSTVSLVLNDRDGGRVKPHIAQRVRDAAEEMGYQPNALARSLRTNRTHIVGFISVEVATTPYAGRIIQGAQDALSELGYLLITVNGDDDKAVEGEIRALKRYGVDGFLYSAMSNRVVDVPESLCSFPLVLVDATDAENRFPSVEPDEFRIGYDATTRLIEAGCGHIAYIGCLQPMIAQTGRAEGYRQALADHGMRFDERLQCDVLNNGTALRAVEELYDAQRPDGFFCFNDARAWYVYETAARRGLTVGRDMSVVGVDNHRVFAETFSPQLTTIELPHYEMGYWAANRLVAAIGDRGVDEAQWPRMTAPLPPLDATSPAKVHCTLIEKESVRGGR